MNLFYNFKSKYMCLKPLKYIVIIIFIGMLYSTRFRIPQYTVFINSFKTDAFPKLNLYYTTPSQNHIRTYTLTGDSLKPPSQANLSFANSNFATASFTEGFLPLKENKAILAKINAQVKPTTPLTYFYNYYKDAYYEIVAPSGPLSQIYFIDQVTHKVKVPNTSYFPLSKFYLNHIIRNNEVYYLLGDTLNASSSELYTLNAHTLKVLHHTHFKTSPLTIYKEHSSLNIKGHAFFIIKEGLGHISSAQINTDVIPLHFTPTYIVSNMQDTLAFTLNTSYLNYALLDSNGRLTTEGSVLLPQENLYPVKALLQGPYLTLLTFTPSHPFYTHYIMIYDINNWQLMYCCALQNMRSYMLMNIST